MKTDVIEIEVPKGHTANFDPKSNKITITPSKPKNVMERIRTIDDVLADNDLSQKEFDELCEDLEDDEKAYRLLKLLVKSLNEGWKPNWDDSNEIKYWPYFDMRGSSGFRFCDCADWRSYSNVGSRLCYKSRELAIYAGEHFTEVYKQFMVLK